jgi:serine/threonine protein kinase
MVDRVGQQLGNYRLINRIAIGGLSTVYLAKNITSKTIVVVKELNKNRPNNTMEEARTQALVISSLQHPHLVPILDFVVENDIFYLVMSYASNGTLRDRHPKGTKVPLPLILSYVRQVADALQFLHCRNLLHLDVKPENILVGNNYEILLSDFGFTAAIPDEGTEESQYIAGTCAYMAPEQFQGKPSRASDQYSLGCVVYEWLCGHYPFSGSLEEIENQHLYASPQSLQSKVPEISPVVNFVVLTALAKDPQERFASIQAFANALERAYRVGPLAATGDWGVPANPWGIQQPGSWGAPVTPQATPWGTPAAQQQQPAWGSPAQQQAGGWGMPAQQPQQPGWGTPAAQQPGGWGQQGGFSPSPWSTPAAVITDERTIVRSASSYRRRQRERYLDAIALSNPSDFSSVPLQQNVLSVEPAPSSPSKDSVSEDSSITDTVRQAAQDDAVPQVAHDDTAQPAMQDDAAQSTMQDDIAQQQADSNLTEENETGKESDLSVFATTRATLEVGDRAIVSKTYTVQAGISQNEVEGSKEEPINLVVPSTREALVFDILCHGSENIELLTDWHKRLQYDRNNKDPQFVEFIFQVMESGRSSLALDFYHERRWLRTTRLEFDAVEEPEFVFIPSEV